MTVRAKAGTSKASAAQRRKVFVDAYIANGENGSAAAIAAGFARKSAGVTASQLLKDPKVSAAIQKRREALGARVGLSVERTLREVARIAYFDPRKLYDKRGELKPITELDDDTAAVIAGVDHVEEYTGRGDERELTGYTKKLKLADKNAALEKAMKHLGLYEKDNSQPSEALGKVLEQDRTEVARRIAFAMALGVRKKA